MVKITDHSGMTSAVYRACKATKQSIMSELFRHWCVKYENSNITLYYTELVEAAMYLYRATKDPYLLEIGVDMMESIEHSTRTKCGYATVRKFAVFIAPAYSRVQFRSSTVRPLVNNLR